VLEKALTCGHQFHATTVPRQERRAECDLHAANALARRGQRKVRPLSTVCDALRLGNMKEQSQINEVETQAWPPGYAKSDV
jgi:hypothetical protein